MGRCRGSRPALLRSPYSQTWHYSEFRVDSLYVGGVLSCMIRGSKPVRRRIRWLAVSAVVLVCLAVAVITGLMGAGRTARDPRTVTNRPPTPCTLEEARAQVGWHVMFPTWVYPGAAAGPIHVSSEGTSQKVVAVWTLPGGASIQLEQTPLKVEMADAGPPRSVTVQGAAADVYRHVREDDGALFIHVVWCSGGVSRVLSGYFPKAVQSLATRRWSAGRSASVDRAGSGTAVRSCYLAGICRGRKGRGRARPGGFCRKEVDAARPALACRKPHPGYGRAGGPRDGGSRAEPGPTTSRPGRGGLPPVRQA